MASPISPLEAIEIIQKAVALYKKIRDAPEEMRAVGQRMENLEFYLSELRILLTDTSRHALAKLRDGQTRHLQGIIREIRFDADDVYAILKTWYSSGSVARAFLAMGNQKRRLEELTASLDQRKQDLRDILQLMGLFGQQAEQTQSGLQPAPSPRPSLKDKPDVGITFIDPSNLARSKVAEGYTKLLREWTTRTNGRWPIKFAHSAGLRIRDRSDCMEVLQSLSRPVNVYAGNKPPNETAMASLFDNKYFNYTYKDGVRKNVSQNSSRGITQNIFKTYDFILVFVGRDHESLLLLKQALIKAKGEGIAPPGKGRIIHLGAYLGKNGNPVNIVDAPKDQDGTDNRANWNATTSQIKLAIKAFLKKELGWQQPPAGLQS